MLKQTMAMVHKLQAETSNELAIAKRANDDLKNLLNFAMSVISAQNDDRKSMEHLRDLASSTNEFGKMAKAAVTGVEDAISREIGTKINALYERMVLYPTNVNFDTLTLSEWKIAYSVMDPDRHWWFVEKVFRNNHLPKKDKGEMLVEIMKTSGSIKAAELASTYFVSISGGTPDMNLIEDRIKWWNENKDKIKE